VSSFSRGFASVLSVYGSDDRQEPTFSYKGRDMASTTTTEALSADWSSIISTNFEVDDEDDDE
jgi:hypothetical protein